MTSVLIVFGLPVFRSGLKYLLEREPDIKVVGEQGSIAAAFDWEGSADVLIADSLVVGRQTPSVIGKLNEHFGAHILLVGPLENPAMVRSSLLAGARGYITEQACETDLCTAVRAVASGREYIDPCLEAWTSRWPSVTPAVAGPKSPQSKDAELLTPKELELVRALVLGYTNAQAADILSLSVRTIEARRAQIMMKLGIASRAEMVRWALGHKVLELDEA